MAWSTPRTWTTNELVTAANMNTYISDDLGFLFNGLDYGQVHRTDSVQHSTSTSYVDVTGMSITLTCTIGAVYVAFGLRTGVSGTGGCHLRLTDGSTTQIVHTQPAIVGEQPATGNYVFTGLSGSTTFKVQFASSSAGQDVYIADDPKCMVAHELGVS
jgi:hypothetical protein